MSQSVSGAVVVLVEETTIGIQFRGEYLIEACLPENEQTMEIIEKQP